MRGTHAVLWLSALSLGLGWARAGDGKDQDHLQGTWAVTELVANGKPAPEEVVQKMKWTVKGDKLTLSLPGRDGKPATKEFRFKLGPTKSPRTIDLTALDGPYKGTVSLGIYELDGDTLKLCVSNNPRKKDRPGAFDSPPGSQMGLFTMKRGKR
jgi:uncharacterized protein (TIGR03067 family)